MVGLALVMLAGAVTAHADRNSDAKAWLGVFTQSLNSELREGIDYQGDGVLVTRVIDGSPADKAGVEKGDVITKVDQQAVDSPESLADAVGSHQAGDDVTLRLVRDGERRTVHATLASRDDSSGDLRKGKDKDGDQDNDKDNDNDSDHERVFEVPVPPTPPDLSGIPNREELRKMIRNGNGMTGMGRGRLGVRIQDNDEDNDGPKGARVEDVVDDSPAQRAGIRNGDVITRVGETSVENSGDLVEALRGKQGHVSIEVYRHGARRTLEVTLGAAGSGDDDRHLQVYRFHSHGNGGSDDSSGDRESLQREVSELRRQIEQLRREIDELRREK